LIPLIICAQQSCRSIWMFWNGITLLICMAMSADNRMSSFKLETFKFLGFISKFRYSLRALK
jgi:hypothetical protein